MKKLTKHQLFLVFLVFFLLVIISLFDFNKENKRAWGLGEPIVSYWAGPTRLTENDVSQMKNGGFNLIWISRKGKKSNETLGEYYSHQLDLVKKYDLRAIVSLGRLVSRKKDASIVLDNKVKRDELTNIIRTIRNHKSLYAYHLIDEPNAHIFTNLKLVKDFILNIDPSHLIYVNLYPNYAKSKQLGVVGNTAEERYNNYSSQFVRVFNPQLLSFDYYAFGMKRKKNTYFKNLSAMRELAKQNKIPFMVILQASSWTVNKHIPTGEELSWQMFTSLAYGAQGISWYVYGYAGHDGGMVYPRVVMPKRGGARQVLGGKPTSLYYYAREVNVKFKLLASELSKFESMGVYFSEKIPTKNFKFKHISSSLNNNKYLIGLFGNGIEVSHALVVNLNTRTYYGRGFQAEVRSNYTDGLNVMSKNCLATYSVEDKKWIDANKSELFLQVNPSDGVLIRLSKKCNY